MRDDRLRRLIEVIYDAAIDPGAWASVMAILKQQFVTNAETFYFLDFPRHAMRPLHVDGIGPSYYRAFPDRYFTPDNPWIRAEPLHRPGVIRTDRRLQVYFKDAEILRRLQQRRSDPVLHAVAGTRASRESPCPRWR